MPAISQTAGTVIGLALGILSAIALTVWGVYEWRRRGRCQLLILVAGSAMGFLTSPGLDLVANVRLPPPVAVSPKVYRLFELDEPLWVFPTYPLFLALPAYLTFVALDEQWPRRKLWISIAPIIASNFIGEIFLVRVAGLYWYAGQQPFLALGASPMWEAVYVTASMLMGALLYFLGRRLRGAAWLLTLPVIGSGFMGFMVVAGWPGMIAVHGEVSRPMVPVLGIASLACCAAILYMISLHLRGPDPLRAPTAKAYTAEPG
ncbi:hypothetical protein [Streptomyces sp. MJM1172]|uniref:hypothetical protein n=1 Tax=Streptomyces sp. MJM1172 TaxID=1703926 RepID=UPI000938C380|nr:hypothetical protein [Streptomyces sp. MJM1172]OKI62596.1 hypothetical protein AMK15_16520 [Streptomyces sp. MJM1172]